MARFAKLLGLISAFAWCGAHAQTIPQLPAVSSVNSSDLYATSQSGVTRKATITQLSAALGGALGNKPANSVLANVSNSSAPVSAVSLPSCGGSNNALAYTLGSGFTCNTISSSVIAGTNLSLSANTLNVVNAPTFSGLITGQNGLTISSGASSVQALTATSVNGNTVPTASDTVALLAATQTLTNKSISGSEINSGVVASANGGLGAASLTGYLYGNGASAVTAVSTIPNAGLTNSSVTVNGTLCTLGSSCALTNQAFSVSNIGYGIGQYNFNYGSGSTWYNAGFRNDGSNVYLLVSDVQATQAAAQTAGFNALRPFVFSNSTGAVTIDGTGVGTTIGGLITGQNGLTISSGASSVQALTATSVNGNTVPTASDTVALLAATQTLTNKSISGSEINSGVVASANGGTGTASPTGYAYFNGASVPTFSSTVPVSTGVGGLGSGVATALAQAANSTNGFLTTSTASGAYCALAGCTVSGAFNSTGGAVFNNTSSPVIVYPATTPTSIGTATQVQIGEATNNFGYRLNLGYTLIGGAYYGVVDAIAGGVGGALDLQPSGGSVFIGSGSRSYRGITGGDGITNSYCTGCLAIVGSATTSSAGGNDSQGGTFIGFGSSDCTSNICVSAGSESEDVALNGYGGYNLHQDDVTNFSGSAPPQNTPYNNGHGASKVGLAVTTGQVNPSNLTAQGLSVGALGNISSYLGIGGCNNAVVSGSCPGSGGTALAQAYSGIIIDQTALIGSCGTPAASKCGSSVGGIAMDLPNSAELRWWSTSTNVLGELWASSSGLSFINPNGTCTIEPTSSGLICTSDSRLKNDLGLTQDALSYVDSFKVHDFTWKKTGKSAVGVFAQEVRENHPDMVIRDTSDLCEGGCYQVQGANVWELVKAIQQLQLHQIKQDRKIASLEARLNNHDRHPKPKTSLFARAN